jgi:hypothetical protein
MEKSEEKQLKSIQKQLKKFGGSDMRVINADRLYAEVVRCIQPIRDRESNISKLNNHRGNHRTGEDSFPLQYEEIKDFCMDIESGLKRLEGIFFKLLYFSPPPEDYGKRYSDDIRLLKIFAESDLTKEEELKIKSLELALRFILIKQLDMNPAFRRSVTGLKMLIRNLQRVITEEKLYEDTSVLFSSYKLKELDNKAEKALSLNTKISKMKMSA